MPDPTSYTRISYKDAESSLPNPATGDIATPSLKNRGTLVVLDDDPTGTQTVHDITVLTTFEKDVLIDQFKTKESGFFILTNTRAYHHNEVSRSNLRHVLIYSMMSVVLILGGSSGKNTPHETPRECAICRKRNRHGNRDCSPLRLHPPRPLSPRKRSNLFPLWPLRCMGPSAIVL